MLMISLYDNKMTKSQSTNEFQHYNTDVVTFLINTVFTPKFG